MKRDSARREEKKLQIMNKASTVFGHVDAVVPLYGTILNIFCLFFVLFRGANLLLQKMSIEQTLYWI